MADDLLTIKEIARRINLPESNVRYYRDKFQSYLPSVGSGRRKRFLPAAMDVFEKIAQGLEQGLSSEQIQAVLEEKFTRQPAGVYRQEQFISGPVPDIYSEPEPSFPGAIISSQAMALEKMAQAIKLERGFRQELGQMQKGCARMKKALVLLWKEQKRLGYKQPGELNLEAELDQIKKRQADLEIRLEKELGELKKELKKCQFWTKRAVLQTAGEKLGLGKDLES
ncbi:MerR family transcriptional regulator [Desulfonatronovibrio hydrogenovorans]|uniref:MerR family transcriptional regulator n=1 Tax=Desulfonatronovibrio hydrogenovorans TaxID=53245 RepID=UPI00048FE407|nr:MerR family transcriptional regulator [Desulfonatronovibrio hydrogenovorans]